MVLLYTKSYTLLPLRVQKTPPGGVGWGWGWPLLGLALADHEVGGNLQCGTIRQGNFAGGEISPRPGAELPERGDHRLAFDIDGDGGGGDDGSSGGKGEIHNVSRGVALHPGLLFPSS